MKDRVFTPDVISKLKENEVFVFGSNKNGNHAAGAALFAVEKFGAVMGQAEGLQGQSYAFPTLNENMEKVSMDEIKSSVLKLYDAAKSNPEKTFYVTKVGCGIAGFSVAEMKDVFKRFLPPENVVLPREFCVTEGFKAFNTDMTCRGKKYEENETFEEEVTPEVCERGLHFCESPLDTLDYYPLLNDKAEYQPRAKVEAKGVTVSDNNKTSTNRLKIGCKLTLPKFIEMSVNFEHEKIAKSVNDSPGCKKEIASGYNSTAASSGENSKAASSGNYSKAASVGSFSSSEASGEECIAAAIGREGKARASKGGWIVLTEIDKEGHILDIKSTKVDGKKIKADTWYRLEKGKFIETE